MEQIGVIGVGKLGICFSLSVEEAGYEVIGYDINSNILNGIKNKSIATYEPKVNDMLNKSTKFKVTNNIEDIFKLNKIFVLVATPSNADGSYDHSSIDQIVEQITQYYSIRKTDTTTDLIIISTVMPTYCDSIQNKLTPYNIEVSYNPEFIAQGSIIKDTKYPDMILIGERTQRIGNYLESLYKKIVKNNPTFCRMTPLEAEITKISLNCFLTTKIAFANTVGDLAISQGCRPHKILSAIGSDTRVGKKYFNYGFGYGGPCFPRDNKAYSFFSKMHNLNHLIGESVDKSNNHHLDFMFNYIKQLLDSENKNGLFTQVSYKKDCMILTESQQLLLALKLSENGCRIYINNENNIRDEINKNYPSNQLIFINKLNEISNYLNITDMF